MTDAQPQWIKRPKAVPEDVRYAHSLGRGRLLREQLEELVKAINPAYVETKQSLTYLAQHQARAEMNRIFGYGNWDVDADDPTLMYEVQQPGSKDPNKLYWVVAYRIRVTVKIRDLWGMPLAEFTGVHAEENAPQPNRGEAHALALTSVDSYALRRALINLGDRFGLGLYAGGSKNAHGLYTIQLQDDVLYHPWEQRQGDMTIVQPGAVQIQGGADPQQVAQQAIHQAEAQQAQAAPRQSSPQMQAFGEVQQGLQEQREQSKSAMQQRLQQGLMQDGDQS